MSNCRFCKTPLEHVVLDLGLSPVSNEFRSPETIDEQPQVFYPLKTMVCENCWLVQLTDVDTPPHFDEDYAYFSSYSTSWLAHAKKFALEAIPRLGLNENSLVIELASNDGYLLQYFKNAGVNVLGVEPSANVAARAKADHDIDSVVDFFGIRIATQLRDQGKQADLIVGNNVLAHVPDINDFVGGAAIALAKGGTATFEFPHLLKMITLGQFDTIYHEHFSYLSLMAVSRIFAHHGLRIYGAQELTTHGGSLRVYTCHEDEEINDEDLAKTLNKIRNDETEICLHSVEGYAPFGQMAQDRKSELLKFLIEAKQAGSKVLGYGAPAKGNTLLNYFGIGPELLEFTTDRSPQKLGKYLPGVHIPVRGNEELLAEKPDYILILPWNLRDEISAQLSEAREWGCKFVVAIPSLEVF